MLVLRRRLTTDQAIDASTLDRRRRCRVGRVRYHRVTAIIGDGDITWQADYISAEAIIDAEIDTFSIDNSSVDCGQARCEAAGSHLARRRVTTTSQGGARRCDPRDVTLVQQGLQRESRDRVFDRDIVVIQLNSQTLNRVWRQDNTNRVGVSRFSTESRVTTEQRFHLGIALEVSTNIGNRDAGGDARSNDGCCGEGTIGTAGAWISCTRETIGQRREQITNIWCPDSAVEVTTEADLIIDCPTEANREGFSITDRAVVRRTESSIERQRLDTRTVLHEWQFDFSEEFGDVERAAHRQSLVEAANVWAENRVRQGICAGFTVLNTEDHCERLFSCWRLEHWE